jgi:hypothetical protein
MGWVVKRWRTDGLERLLAEDARAAARAARASSERDARRARRGADRAVAEAAAELAALERVGVGLQARVRVKREALRARSAPAVPTQLDRTAGAAGPGPGSPAAPLVRLPARRRGARASLRDSALGELFRATTAG